MAIFIKDHLQLGIIVMLALNGGTISLCPLKGFVMSLVKIARSFHKPAEKVKPVLSENVLKTVAKDIRKAWKKECVGRKWKPELHPSKIHDECPLQWQLMKANDIWPDKEVISPGLKACFDIGTAFHEHFQKFLFKNGIIKSTEEPSRKILLKDDHTVPLSMRCDGELTATEDAIIEIKTASEYSFNNVKKYGLSSYYLWQAHCYMYGFKKKYTLFIFVNKGAKDGSKPFYFYAQPFEKRVWKEIKGKVCLINDIYQGKVSDFVEKSCSSACKRKNCPVLKECLKLSATRKSR